MTKRFIVGQQLNAPNVTLKEVAKIVTRPARNNSLEVLSLISASRKVITAIRALQIKLLIHVAHDVVERRLPFRTTTHQKIEDHSDQLAFGVITDRSVWQIRRL